MSGSAARKTTRRTRAAGSAAAPLREVPPPEEQPDAPPATITVAVPDGHSVVMSRTMSGEDFLMLYRISHTEDDSRLVELYGPILDMIDRHVVMHDYPGKLLAQEMPVLLRLWVAWNEAIRADALDRRRAGS